MEFAIECFPFTVVRGRFSTSIWRSHSFAHMQMTIMWE